MFLNRFPFNLKGYPIVCRSVLILFISVLFTLLSLRVSKHIKGGEIHYTYLAANKSFT
jgi:hypothetical protein